MERSGSTHHSTGVTERKIQGEQPLALVVVEIRIVGSQFVCSSTNRVSGISFYQSISGTEHGQNDEVGENVHAAANPDTTAISCMFRIDQAPAKRV